MVGGFAAFRLTSRPFGPCFPFVPKMLAAADRLTAPRKSETIQVPPKSYADFVGVSHPH